MKFYKPYTLKEIAQIIGAKFVGEENFSVLGLNEIHRVEEGDIVFVDHPKYYDKALKSKATTILINKEVDCPQGKSLIISDDPFRDFVKIGQYFSPFVPAKTQIAETAKIGINTIIQPNVCIGNHVSIGENCIIHANVTINDHTQIGNHVIIGSGTVLGSDAFYYKKRESGYDRLKSVGNVVIENYVEIGSNCAIDRGVTASTTIGEGTKLDNLIQIGHDTIIGKNCLIASQCGIAGCTTIEDDVVIWGQVGIVSGITIGAKSVLYAQSGVSKSLEGAKIYMGSPAEEYRSNYKKMAFLSSAYKNSISNDKKQQIK
jgi:UDP-3-O-[3-hydroxymyristoyl] glucosamine N-acyltransferase